MWPKGILLDIGRRFNGERRPNFVGLDSRPGPGVSIVHAFDKFPYPFKDAECLTITVKRGLEYVQPQRTIEFFDEMWRILVPNGQLVVCVPYAGSPLHWEDPLNCNAFMEKSFYYFDPRFAWHYAIHQPRPWRLEKGFPVWQATGVIEALMTKVSDE